MKQRVRVMCQSICNVYATASLINFTKSACKFLMGSRHVWKASTPIMVPPLASLVLVTANPCLLIVLIIIIEVRTTLLTDVLVNCKMRAIWKEYLW